MIKVGLTGGYATGKSFVAAELEKLGCHLIYADRLGHTVLEPGGEAYAPTVKEFGPQILNADGRIDRKRLAGIVFGSAECLEKLSGFVHPAVMRLEDEMAEHVRSHDPNGIVVIEAAILIETGRYKALDRLILTTCSEERQIARAIKRDDLTREEALARIRRQMPAAEKQKYADFVVDTEGDKAATLDRVRNVHHQLKRLGEAKE
ncbi:MAG: dephospho-CoA kinase [Acidobacteriaceae bacterium]|nr:dephospho-CoA kinase [Acidobacteriaceae bacterium]MBV9499188.1 dephospho-CoA kinase [Acidobacteriaceae bacterium]